MEKKFVRVNNRVIHIDAIGYVDFLDSGRAMLFIPGLSQEKQNIALDPGEASRLRALLEQYLIAS
jgi:hypothetical protein